MDRAAAVKLRRQLRARRRALPDNVQLQHAHAVAAHLRQCARIRRARRIGLYLACDGELDLQPLRIWLLRRHTACWLPVLAGKRLRFRPWHWREPMRANRYGIREPVAGPEIDVDELDVLLLPLVACDRQGNRLGMGAGWYDRTLADDRLVAGGPWRVGVAHQLQQLTALPVQPWDVPLQALVTEQGLTHFQQRRTAWPTG